MNCANKVNTLFNKLLSDEHGLNLEKEMAKCLRNCSV